LADWGYGAIFLSIVADSFGVPIPGEVMLLLAAVYAGASHQLVLPLVIGTAVLAAVAGDNLTYTFGRLGGYPLLQRYGQIVHVGRRRLRIGQYLFRRYGGVVVWTGRLIPVLHIWTAVLAGVNGMPWTRFAPANAVGAIVWATCLSLAGYTLGRQAFVFSGYIAGAAIPLALLIAGATVLLLHLNERRLYALAEQALGPEDEPGG
jgi:membrane protein DedA with SNARE-associated domain